MQKDLQAQIEEIRLLLETHAAEASSGMDEEKATLMMQNRARGINARKRVQEEAAAGKLPGQARIAEQEAKDKEYERLVKVQSRARGIKDRKDVAKKAEAGELPGQPRIDSQSKHVVRLQARTRGKSARKLVEQKAAAGVLPGQPRLRGEPPSAAEEEVVVEEEEELELSAEGTSYFDENESVDSDYDYEDSAFEGLGNELLAGKLKLAKVYGQEEPPAAEDELEWEVRYFVLYDSGRVLHFDDMADGLPVGDRGLIDLAAIKAVEKVLGVPTFVMKGEMKVYLFKLEPHDEVMMRTWIGAISQELAR